MSAKFALIVANSRYDDPRFAALVTPGQDAGELAAVLEAGEIGGFTQVRALVDQAEPLLRREIARFFRNKAKDDLLLLYFSGHGVLDEHGLLYFAAHDTEHELLEASALPAAFVRQQMDNSSSRRQVLVLDCCHSGAFGRGAKGAAGAGVNTAARFDVEGYGRAVLTASDATQYAWEGEQVRGQPQASLFTRFLVQGLRSGQADADGDGQVTLDEWYDYAYRAVVQATPKQKPQKFVDRGQGQLLIARSPRGVTRPGALPPELEAALLDTRAFVRLGAVDELGRLLPGGDPALALAARLALERLLEDDSRRVLEAARGLLEGAPPPVGAPAWPTGLPSKPALTLAPGVSLELLRISASEFLMGSADDDQDADSDEKPQHSLYLDEYWIGKYPVTNAQFEAFVKAMGYRTTAEEQGESYTWTGSKWETVKGACWKHPSGPKSDLRGRAEHPVVHVSWDDAVAFCEWASEVAKREVRLPSEAEWEKAARGTDGRLYPWGDEPPDERRCNFAMNVKSTTPVGQYSPQGDSPYGCADMAGNVWEWTRSLWGKNLESPDYKYPYDPGDGREDMGSRDWRVLRGGAF
ncbi:MAG: SUMF1/EgtB/PvdO family nonheme iron enzyme, partial [Anaerolineales bacterium]|nr:SUMF1/EgtB/PvdO family nonheme iron enzyme [Anaerolineales bacterium]